MRMIETDYWRCALPDEWLAEQNDDAILIVDEDEVSSIEIDTLFNDEGDVSVTMLREIAAEELPDGAELESVSLGDFIGFRCEYVDDDGAWREWILGRKQLMLFITHGCAKEHQGMDDSAVDEILETLEYGIELHVK